MPNITDQLIKQARTSLKPYKEAAEKGEVWSGSLEFLQEMKDELYSILHNKQLRNGQCYDIAALIYQYRDTEIELGFILLHTNLSKAIALLEAKDMKGCETVYNQMTLNRNALQYRITKLVECEKEYMGSFNDSQYHRGKMRQEAFNSFLSAEVPFKILFEPTSKPFAYSERGNISASGKDKPGIAISEAQQYVSTHAFSFFSSETVENDTEIVALKGSATCA